MQSVKSLRGTAEACVRLQKRAQYRLVCAVQWRPRKVAICEQVDSPWLHEDYADLAFVALLNVLSP